MNKKLVRDNILKDKKISHNVYIADDKEYKKRLFNKLLEESQEVIDSQNNNKNLKEELADVLEVFYSILDLENLDIKDIEKIRKEKLELKGCFKEKLILDLDSLVKDSEKGTTKTKTHPQSFRDCPSECEGALKKGREQEHINLTVYTDGGSRGNPGPSGIGVYIVDNETGEVIEEYSEYLGIVTNNQAEYTGALVGLDKSINTYKSNNIILIMDSELVIKQLSGEYKVKNEGLKKIYDKIQELLKGYSGKIEYRAVRRAFNKDADRLANNAMDRR